ncbi:hypothetical protein GCM10027275_54400 [Rhabdobacter roseus]|uniref:CRISPR system Cms protein Csm4 n=1 Tax=Rhabdobacter roseus TaxID=1655419 RepID=A0A840TW32_9BACT|nr:type III-A CRISPR-associated RAMP protein Csm4 [Rhabdobacter roseus]MBB5287454.1 CRISPR-associated protein Csm4 [Rhabdobacter roseus]
MTFDTIYFEFKTPFHISNARSDYGQSERIFHSDALYAAIMQAWAMLGKSDWITPRPAFTLSSLFPFTCSNVGKRIHFFPKPFLQPNVSKNAIRPEDAKIFKKVKYIDAWHLEQYLNKTPLQTSINEVKGSYQTYENIDKGFLQADVIPRIRKPRLDKEDAEPFYTERLYYKTGSGMFCLIQFEDFTAKAKVQAALNLLADNGLGTDRNVGNGLFNWEMGQLSISLPPVSDWSLNLSLFCPENKEQLAGMLASEARYEIVKRGGWLSDPYNSYRKRSVYMFLEGSLLKTSASPKGNTIDLKPDNSLLPTQISHPIWRIGKALFLPVQI